MKSYLHTQSAPEIVVLLAASSLMLAIGAVVLPLLLLLSALALFLAWLFRSFTIEITGRELSWRFGRGWIRRRVALTEIVSASVARASVLGGWGVHCNTFGWLYDVPGFNAVAVVLRNGRRFYLGSDEPELLAARLGQSSSSRSA